MRGLSGAQAAAGPSALAAFTPGSVDTFEDPECEMSLTYKMNAADFAHLDQRTAHCDGTLCSINGLIVDECVLKDSPPPELNSIYQECCMAETTPDRIPPKHK